jgi:hypothetical protein
MDQAQKKVVEVYIVINEDGDYAAHKDKDAAVEGLNDNYGYTVARLVKLKVAIRLPVAVEAAIEVADEAGDTITAEVE